MGFVKNGSGFLVHETLKPVSFNNECMNRVDDFSVDSDVVVLVRLISYTLTFKCWESTAVVLLVVTVIAFIVNPMIRHET